MTLEVEIQEAKEYYRKRLQELSEKSVGEIPKLENITWEQKKWIKRRLKQPAGYWRSFT